jgi:N-acetylglucosaminyldiphosphoundecaprenol N-acetyl-beta-D-mannosaminyltransferase
MYGNRQISQLKFVDLLGYRLFQGDTELLRKAITQHVVASGEGSTASFMCLNPHSYVVAKKNPMFRRALEKADVLIADGVGITITGKLFSEQVPRITGDDLFHSVMRVANEKKLKVFFLGSSDATIDLLKSAVQRDYPKIKGTSGFSPPFVTEFTQSQNAEMVTRINDFKPDILWVGLTAPKQELWIGENKQALDVKVIGAIGAVFDFYSGNINRAPKWVGNLGLEWLVRLIISPSKMWKRTFVSMPLFVADVVKSFIKSK